MGTCMLEVYTRTECKIFPAANVAFKAEISFHCRGHVHRIKNSYRKPLCILPFGWLRRLPPMSGVFYPFHIYIYLCEYVHTYNILVYTHLENGIYPFHLKMWRRACILSATKIYYCDITALIVTK